MWRSLTADEVGLDYRNRKCSRCGAPFLASYLDDVVFVLDVGYFEAQQTLARICSEHGIDVCTEDFNVCEWCSQRIEKLLN